MNIKISGGRIIDPSQQLDKTTDLFIANGSILAIGNAPEGFIADEQYDAQGQIVCPGLVDLSAHLREPGDTQKGTIATETAAAAAGGITTLVTPPTTSPIVDTTAVAEMILDRAADSGFARVLPLGALTKSLAGEQLAPMHALASSGCIGFTNARHTIDSSLVLMRALDYAATYDLLVIFQAEDRTLAANGCMHEGTTSTRLGLIGIPSAAETIEVSRCLLLIEETGVKAHFGQISCRQSLQLIDLAKKQGLRVSADVAIHQLMLTDEHIDGFDSRFHVNPPLRSTLDRTGLREGLVRGSIDAICSDHQPQDVMSKQAPFAATEPGISGLETLLPLCLMLVEKQIIDMHQLIDKVCIAPARVLGIEAGTLQVGSTADICIFDPNETWTLTPDTIRSKGLNTPFMGYPLKGRVSLTLLDGRVVYRRS